MIETADELARYLEQSRSGGAPPTCAIDTEADSLHRYRESLCLIQFADRQESVLIDPLAIDDLSSLQRYLEDATVWMHGADYDMTMLKRQFGSLPATVYDTQIGARLLGVRKFGLGDLVSHYFGIELVKTSQKADWGKRPLSEKMLDYALNDVRYLLEMGDKIVADLQDRGRYEWFVESCVAARQKVLEREDTHEENWRIQGSGKLDPRDLAMLKALWHWRDGEASSWDKPCFMVATNRQLLEWTLELGEGQKPELPHHYRPDRIKRFRAAVAQATALPANEWPTRPVVKRRKRDRNFDQRVDQLLKTRNAVANALDIEGSLIASRAVLEQIAADEVEPQACLLSWQLHCLNFPD